MSIPLTCRGAEGETDFERANSFDSRVVHPMKQGIRWTDLSILFFSIKMMAEVVTRLRASRKDDKGSNHTQVRPQNLTAYDAERSFRFTAVILERRRGEDMQVASTKAIKGPVASSEDCTLVQ